MRDRQGLNRRRCGEVAKRLVEVETVTLTVGERRDRGVTHRLRENPTVRTAAGTAGDREGRHVSGPPGPGGIVGKRGHHIGRGLERLTDLTAAELGTV